MKRVICSLLFAALAGAALPAYSQTLVVGTCKSAKTHYTTIQSAVNAAPADATVLVCPGTYAEQVVITVPLTLKGISVPPLGNPAMVSPTSGLVRTLSNGPASFIAVNTNNMQDSVNIQGITMIGDNACPAIESIAGILFLSSSGTITNSAVQNMASPCTGAAMFAENDNSQTMNLKAQNNLLENFHDGYGIWIASGPSSGALNFQIQGNTIRNTVGGIISVTNGKGVAASQNYIQTFGDGMLIYDAAVVDNNTISTIGEGVGIVIDGNGSSISNNTVVNDGPAGIVISGDYDASLSSNRIVADGFPPRKGRVGILSASTTASIKGNTVGNADHGIDIVCGANAVNSNLIFDTTVGILGGPGGSALANSFVNVTTPQVACQ